MGQSKSCADCGITYNEPLLVCPDCFRRAEMTADPRLGSSPWLDAARQLVPGESIEDYAARVAESLVYVSIGHVPGIFREGVDYGHAVWIGGYQESPPCTEAEAKRLREPYLRAASATICAVVRSVLGQYSIGRERFR